ncbi:MAG: SpoIID/LytB domain-containing protein [Lachnospiraceae bacterium]
MFQRSHQKRWLAALTALLLLAGLAAPVLADSAEIPSAGQTIDPQVRVLLRRLQITDRIDVSLSSAYGLCTEQGTELYLPGGSQISFQLKEGSIFVYCGALTLNGGADLTLTRYADPDATEIGFRRVNYPALYQGDLRLKISEGALLPILTLHVEDYLLGVVPYEMSNSFPLEALKAQTVAARTYVLRKRSPDADYDVVDTTNDQVFRGYISGYGNSEKAVEETYGVCGFYKGKLAQCYYAASNGGQTELVESVWPGGGDYGYYAVADDPYDVENPYSVVKSVTLQKSYTNEEHDIAPYGLRNLLATVLRDELTALGFDPAPASIRVNTVSDARLSGEGKRMDTLYLTVQISGRTRQDAAVPAVDSDQEEVSLVLDGSAETAAPTPGSSPSPEVSAVPSATPSATPAPVYGPFTVIEQPFQLEIAIFPMAEKLLAMSISSNYENELWTLVETDTAYRLEARRFGHGVGMSQRGAEWMAGRYQKTCQEILAFYYPGMSLMRYDFAESALPAAPEALAATPGPAPTPTPRPTLMPVSEQPADGQWIALVTGIDDDSSLNLRSLPDLSGDIVMRLYKNQRLLVLERCEEEGWVKVRTDAAEGYVMESYLTAE